jgi:hypothetical protein
VDTSARKRVFRVAQILISLAIVVGIFAFAIPKFADYGDVLDAVVEMTWLEITTLAAVSAINIVTYWPVMVASMPGLTLAQAAVNNGSSTSIANTLPGGGLIATGISYSMYRSRFPFANALLYPADRSTEPLARLAHHPYRRTRSRRMRPASLSAPACGQLAAGNRCSVMAPRRSGEIW